MVFAGHFPTVLDDLDLFVRPGHLLSMLSSEQCRAARALLDWTQEELAERAGISRSTVRGFENGQHEPHRASAAMIRAALEQAGVVLINADDQGEGVRFQSPRRSD
jgi:transcriptional regulator with XRE-family HTH domain